ncbi:hypothetical protein C8J57DRAFT_1269062 [Mycena rebaudengoi]|nr:hypothetical protein C8J57DRAFT_1269062 [Mycena rebaudengoi]
MASSTSKTATSATAAAVPNRRASIVPAKTSAPTSLKPSLSASASSKPTTASTATNARGSVTSPVNGTKPATATATATATASRPRASVSGEAKRTPLAGRQSLSSTTKPAAAVATSKPASSTTRAPVTKTSTAPKVGGSASITSIKEVQEDTKALEDLQAKLQEATESLVAKTEAAADLEAQVENLKATLTTTLAEVETKGSTAAELAEAKAASEAQLKEATEALEKLNLEHQSGASALQAIQADPPKLPLLSNKLSSKACKHRYRQLEGEISASKESLNALQSSQPDTVAEAALAAAVEHEALLKAQENFSAIEAEIQQLKAAHTQALEDAHAKIEAAEGKAGLVESLDAQLVGLRAEKEDAVTKLSEIEVEVLELKESHETAEDDLAKAAASISSLEQQLAQALAATQQAIDDATAKETEYTSKADEAKALEALKTELEAALASHEETKAAAHAAVEEHTRLLGEAEEGYLKKQSELSDEVRRITMELEGQEAQYNAKVDAVKAEHEKLLEDAFQRAKAQASELHQQDLQTLRAGSSSTMDQVRAAHEAALGDLKAEHAATLESTVGDLEKRISNLNLELKATQDDLSKAKAKAAEARSEVESLTTQVDEARAVAAAVPAVSPEQAEEVGRLTKELAVTKDDLQAVTEMLNLTKASLQDMSNNHQAELEEAAKGRAEEVTKLRGTHDEEITALVTQKSELLTKLSDLEGDLATLRATIDSEHTAPKTNGTSAVAPQSPGITKEELQRMHEAHNLKVHDMQAEHEKALKALQEQLDAKLMEIKYLESDQEEHQERITRLQEELAEVKNAQ